MKNNRIANRQNSRPLPEYNVRYASETVHRPQPNQIINGYFPKASSVKAMAIKKVNNTLCGLLLCAIFISAVSYYFVGSSEIKLNEYSRATLLLNVENAELQNKLDRLKSFNNVDLTMQKSNLLQKPEKVIEATEVNTTTTQSPKNNIQAVKPKAWTIGY